jgi:hypothetical protein
MYVPLLYVVNWEPLGSVWCLQDVNCVWLSLHEKLCSKHLLTTSTFFACLQALGQNRQHWLHLKNVSMYNVCLAILL